MWCVPCPCTILYKNTNHQQMHKESFIINRNTLLHVSTLLGHIQGELFVIVTLRLHFTVEWECAVYCVLEAWTLRRRSRHGGEFTPPKTTQYTVNSTFSLDYKVQPECNGNKKILPEDDPAGSKHVGVCYNWWQNALCAFFGDQCFCIANMF
jgi:hypothetical protein